MNKARPFYLNLVQIRLPIGGFVSILHRASGAVLSIVVPFLLYALMLSLRSPEDFGRMRELSGSVFGTLILLGLTWALVHHFLAGLRHLGFDLGLGEGKQRARQTAWLVLGLAIVLAAGLVL